MSNTIVIAVSLAIIILVVADRYRASAAEKEKTKYTYVKKQRVMTEHELDFYKKLNDAVGGTYCILAQAHLSAFLEHKVPNGQNWKAAFRHINGKSIDYLLCDKQRLAPLLAIELDDASHEKQDRRLRDEEVKRIFREANLPLVRVPSHDITSVEEMKTRISELLSANL
jgi:hypothetical protein